MHAIKTKTRELALFAFSLILPIFFAQGEKATKEYDIRFASEYIGYRNFKISGTTTNLPDGAVLFITIYDENYFKYDKADSDWRAANLTYFTDRTTVERGKFKKTLTASQFEAPMKSDKYWVKISFNPGAQTNKIKNVVGENGEYLEGRLVNTEVRGLKTLEIKQLVDITKRNTTAMKKQEMEATQSGEQTKKMGLGITYGQAMEYLSNSFSMIESSSSDGRKKMVGKTRAAILEIIGDRNGMDTITEAALMILASLNAPEVLPENAAIMIRFEKNILPEWENSSKWITEAIKRSAKSNEDEEIVVGDKLVKVGCKNLGKFTTTCIIVKRK